MTPQDIFDRMVAEGDIILDKLDEWAERAPDKTFVHYGEDGVKLSFSAFKQRTDRLAAGLAAQGVEPGRPVSVLSRNSLIVALSMFAIWRAGAIFAPVNFNLTGPLLAYQLRDTRPAALITDSSFLPVLDEIWPELGIERLIVHVPTPGDHDHDPALPPASGAFGAFVPFGEMEADAAPPVIERTPFDAASIIYTSGTTGPSKGVQQNFRWINQYAFTSRLCNDSDDVIYCDLPLYHVGGAFHLLGRAVWNGNTVGLWDRFSPARFWERIGECQATCCTLLDVMIPRLMAQEPRPDDRANTLNKIHIQPYNASHHELARRFGIDFITVGFGQTESGSVFSGVIDEFPDGHGTPPDLYRGMSKDEYRRQARALGRVIFDGRTDIAKGMMGRPVKLFEAALLDEDDNPVPVGEVGQLCLRPRFPGLILDGYYNKPEATVKVLRNCWFHTGDACRRIDADEDLFVFVDRMGGFFRVRGENVSSYEVESLLARHEAVRAAAAVPLPAAEGGEDDIAVFVELQEGHSLAEGELRDHAARTMPRYMQPRHIRIVEALPVTPTNKIEKYKLKASLVAELAAAPDAAGEAAR